MNFLLSQLQWDGVVLAYLNHHTFLHTISRQYDCRKTPNGGVPSTDSPDDTIMATSQNRLKEQNWCRDCDRSHDVTGNGSDVIGPTGSDVTRAICPLLRPECIYTDSVIDFSTKPNPDDGDSTR